MQSECNSFFGKYDGTISREELMEVLDYDPATGLFRWKVSRTNRIKVGDVAGAVQSGYIKIRIGKIIYAAHRLAWLYVHGEWPPGRLDHRDNDPSNNRIENLRPCTQSQNGANRAMQANNTSGYKGVSWSTRDQIYRVFLKKDGKTKFLGNFHDPEEGHKVWLKAAEEAHGEFLKVA